MELDSALPTTGAAPSNGEFIPRVVLVGWLEGDLLELLKLPRWPHTDSSAYWY